MLIEFYGRECPHCHTMAPLVEKLAKEEGVKIEQKEVWHNRANEHERQKHDQGYCGGVPFFINTETGKHICGSVDYETLRQWAIQKR